MAGCASAQLPQTHPAASQQQRSLSGDLLYLSDTARNDVDVFSYPQGKHVGTLTEFGAPRAECADSEGNVWIADTQALDVTEYAHGGTKPVASLSTPSVPRGCSVDPKRGTLAVTIAARRAVVAIYRQNFRHAWRDPELLTVRSQRSVRYCGYDANGDLFVDGTGKANAFVLAELPRGGHAFIDIAVHASIAAPGQVQWDGTHLAIGDSGVRPPAIYRFSISGTTATKIGSTFLHGTKSVGQFWIENARVVGPDDNAAVGLWKYPDGGFPQKWFDSVRGYGAAVSVTATLERR